MRRETAASAVRRRPSRPWSVDVRDDNLRVLAGSANLPLSQSIADHLDIPLCKMLLSRFADGEVRVKIEESMRGMDVFVVQSTSKPVNEHVMELLIMADATEASPEWTDRLVDGSRLNEKAPRPQATARCAGGAGEVGGGVPNPGSGLPLPDGPPRR